MRAVGLVDLVEEEDARDAEIFEFAQNHAQRRQFALVGLADDDGRVAERQHVARLMREFDRAGQVDEGEAVAEIIDRGDIGLDAGGMGAGLGAGIADRGAVAHRTLARQRAAAAENAFEQGGLAALERADERDQPRPADASVAVLGLAHGSRSFGWFAPVSPCGLSQIFHEAGEMPMFLAGWSGFRLNPSRTKPIDRDQRRISGGGCRFAKDSVELFALWKISLWIRIKNAHRKK